MQRASLFAKHPRGLSMPEIWKPAPGFEDRYEVSNRGRVRSIAF
ncbi:hypothetical protein HZ472_004750, partial [Salmonella enterica]|nr:hypothetical protein [Salmonella enterica]